MNWDSIITFIVVLAIIYILYTVIKGNSLRETFEEVIGLFMGE